MSERGVLLAISSLPGKYGIGDFSKCAFDFIKICNKNGVNIWQILPLNPIGYGHSPYQPFSSFAFDEIYISIEDLVHRGLLKKFKGIKPSNKVNYEKSRYIKEQAIWKAFEEYKKSSKNMKNINVFLSNFPYVKEFCEFLTLKELNSQKTWNEWDFFQKDKPDDFTYLFSKHAFAQMILFEEWQDIRKTANEAGIKIVGDVPFYVGYDSSDVYFNKQSFMLDEENVPTCIAGVPPDYFSELGQRWGNPIWNWDYLYQNEFKLMMDRFVFASQLFDIVRIDHFRAFDSYWSINPKCPTAVDGEWKYPNGYLFFETLFRKYPKINIIVEDLGDLRPEVLILRDHFNLAGMRELEFTIFDDEILNKRYEIENQIYYTTTHDNETLVEWISYRSAEEKQKLESKMNELKIKGRKLNKKLINYALQRKEKLIIISVSDLLGLDKNSRMNTPGTINLDNWTFKLKNLRKTAKVLKEFYR